MLSGPELGRLLKDFEDEYILDDDPEDPKNCQHHEEGLSAQKAFQKHVRDLVNTIKTMGNPYLDNFSELVTLDSRNCIDESVAVTLSTLETVGKQQYQAYKKAVIEERTQPIHATITKNSLALFKKQKPTVKSKKNQKIKVLQNNVSLFGQLYVSLQNRQGDLQEFFAHETQGFPASLSDYGKLHACKKSDLLQCFGSLNEASPPTDFDCKILDGAAVIHFLSTSGVSTFEEYADRVFIAHLHRQLENSRRLDVVWDTYIEDSIKESTREKRGKGLRRKVSSQAKLPSKWLDFLRDPANKTELFSLLTSKVYEHNFPPGKEVHITSGNVSLCMYAPSKPNFISMSQKYVIYLNMPMLQGEAVVSNSTSHTMEDCNHEEADTRIIVHLLHALLNGSKVVQVRTVDTDVVVLLIGKLHIILQEYPLAEIWVAFGVGKSFTVFSINKICALLGQERSNALPAFHAFTGCDTVCGFNGIGKKTAWQVWKCFDDATEAFLSIVEEPFQKFTEDSPHFLLLERMTVLMYDRSSDLCSVNAARMDLFCHKNRSMEHLPPTQVRIDTYA